MAKSLRSKPEAARKVPVKVPRQLRIDGLAEHLYKQRTSGPPTDFYKTKASVRAFYRRLSRAARHYLEYHARRIRCFRSTSVDSPPSRA